jgi:hypothetical protein
MQPILKGTRDDLKWNALFTLLSTERVAPFLPEIGLNLSDLQVVQQCARAFVREHNSASGDRSWYEALLQRTFACIAQAAALGTAQYLYQWAEQEFHLGDDEYHTASLWDTLLRCLAGITKVQIVQLQLPADKVSRIKQVVASSFRGEFWNLRERVREVDQQPLSG